MAKPRFILQAVTDENHAESIRTLLQLDKPTQILISVAFARTKGLDAIETSIQPLADKTKFFVGIRNDITSIQAIKQLLRMKVNLFAVDTGSRQIIFHPKLYLAANATYAIGIIGSANMTFRGLHNNIEVSTHLTLDFAKDPSDRIFADTVLRAFEKMLADYPRHVFKIKDDKHAEQLFEEGRLADESVILAPASGSSVRKGERDDLTPMKLIRVNQPRISKSNDAPAKVAVPKTTVVAKKVPNPTRPIIGTKYRVWESKPLNRRDLTIPTSNNTNPTGSMGLKKGLYNYIDQRHYFYDDVFSDLTWTPDKPGSKKLHALANFEVVIKNISYGIFEMKISHNTNTRSKSYEQSNMMTHLHWGSVRALIAKEDLLGRTLYLYRKDGSPPEFMIEID